MQKTSTASLPENTQIKTVDDSSDEYKTARCDASASANAMVTLMRFQYGVPNYRLAGIEGHAGLPLPEGTQNQMMNQVYAAGLYIYESLIIVGAQGDLFQNDDTRMRITDVLAVSRKMAKRGEGTRVSTRTSVIVANSLHSHQVGTVFYR